MAKAIQNTDLDGDLIRFLHKVLLVGGLVPLKAFLKLLDLLGHNGVLGDLGAIKTFLLDGSVGS